MLLSIEEADFLGKYLKPDGETKFFAINIENISSEDRKKLLDFDASYIPIYGEHIITNYEDLIN